MQERLGLIKKINITIFKPLPVCGGVFKTKGINQKTSEFWLELWNTYEKYQLEFFGKSFVGFSPVHITASYCTVRYF